MGSESRALLIPTLLKAWTLYQTYWPSFRSFTLTLVWWQPQSTLSGRNWLPPCTPRLGSHHFLGSYLSMVKLVASTELKRLRPTGRCGATRGDRGQKLSIAPHTKEFRLGKLENKVQTYLALLQASLLGSFQRMVLAFLVCCRYPKVGLWIPPVRRPNQRWSLRPLQCRPWPMTASACRAFPPCIKWWQVHLC